MAGNGEVTWVDMSAIGITMGSWTNPADPSKSLPLAIVDANGRYDKQIRSLGFSPMPGVKANGIYVRADTVVSPPQLREAFGQENVRFLKGPREYFDQAFQKAFRTRTQLNAKAAFAQNRVLGLNHLGETVQEASLGRYVVREVDGIRTAVREGIDDPAVFMRADSRESLQQVARGFVSRILLRGDNLRRENVKNLIEVSNEADFSARDYQEAIESALNDIFSEAIAAAGTNTGAEALSVFDIANRLYIGMPELRERTVNSIANQQYSTPVPMSAIAQTLLATPAELAGSTVLEPTVGNGGLVSYLTALRPLAPGLKIYGVEIDPERVETAQGVVDQVLLGDATTMDFRRAFGHADGFDFVIANPPFGSMDELKTLELPAGSLAETMDVLRVDHFLLLSALHARKNVGRAVFITGADNVMQPGVIKGRSASLLNYLYDHYEVDAVVDIAGELYKKQGAGYPLRMFVVGNRRDEPVQTPVPTELMVIRSYEGLRSWADTLISKRGYELAPVAAGPDRTDATTTSPRDSVGVRRVARTENALPEQSASQVGSVVDLLEVRDAVAEPRDDHRQESDFQQRYVSFSNSGEPSTMIPANLSGPVYEALAQIKVQFGDIDEYVARELEYSVNDLSKYFSPEQVDALAMICSASSRGLGFLLADQMGVGKGRVLAGFARRERLHGRIPMFVTVTDNLFTDFLERDLASIDSRHLFQAPLIVNDGAKTVDAGGNVVVRSMKRPEYRAHAEEGRMPEGTDIIMLTYSQLSRPHEKHLTSRYMRALCSRYQISLILDESHKGAGASHTSENLLGMISGLEMTGGNVVYSSGTPIKGAKNLALYLRILPQGVNTQELLDAVNSDPISLQEALNYEIAIQGCLISRELDNTGIEKEFVLSRYVERNEQIADQLSSILTAMNYISGDVRKLVTQQNKAFEKLLNSIPEHERGGHRMGATSINFGSRMHSLVCQMLVSLKAREIVDLAIEALENNEKPIIALQRTGESMLTDFVTGRNAEFEDEVAVDTVSREFAAIELDKPLSFKDYLRRTLDKILWIKETGRYGDVSTRRAISEEIVESEKHILALIAELPDDLPLTPIDYIREELAKHGYTTGEISGRNLRTRTLESGKVLIEAMPGRGDKTRVQRAVRDFNNGETDAIVLTASGSTGISLQASPAVGTDLRTRTMIKGEMQADIATERQMDGRHNRTGQIAKPKYKIPQTGLTADDRLSMMFNTKNRSLTASTVSNRDSKDLIREVPDLLNVVGDMVALDLLASNPELSRHLDIQPPDDEEWSFPPSPLYYIKLLTGRVSLLKVQEQKALYADLQGRFLEQLDKLKAEGRNPLEVECHDWRAKFIDRRVFMGATKKTDNEKSQLNAPVFLSVVEYQQELKAVKAAEIDDKVAKSKLAGWGDTGVVVKYLRDFSQQILIGAKALKFATVEAALADKDPNNVKDMAAKLAWLDMNLPSVRPGGVFYKKDLEAIEVPTVVLRVQVPGKLDAYTRLGEYVIHTMQPGSDAVTMETLSSLFANSIDFDPWEFSENESARYIFDSAENGMVTKRARLLDGNLFDATSLNLRERVGRKIVYTDEAGSRQHGILVYADISDKALASIPERLRDPALIRLFVDYRPVTTDTTGDWKGTQGGVVLAKSNTGQVLLKVPGTKKRGGHIFLDPALSGIKGQEDKCIFHLDFKAVNGLMVAALPDDRAEDVIRYLMDQRMQQFFTVDRDELQRVRDVMAEKPAVGGDRLEAA